MSFVVFFFSSRRRHTRWNCDWSSDVCSSDLAHRQVSEVQPYSTSPLAGSLLGLGPLELRLVRRAEGEALWAHLLCRYHYLGYSRPVGEHLKYLVMAGGRPVACL